MIRESGAAVVAVGAQGAVAGPGGAAGGGGVVKENDSSRVAQKSWKLYSEDLRLDAIWRDSALITLLI